MNKVELYASFISDQVALNEMFGGRDKGYPYKEKPIKSKDTYGYNIDLPDNVSSAGVGIMHGFNTAHVAFSMPKAGYGISPEAKKTYHEVYDQHLSQHGDKTDAHIAATEAVLHKHSAADAKLANDALHSGSTITRPNNSSHHNYSIFSTMKKIMDEHGKKHPNMKQFMYTSSDDSDNRGRLYSHFAQKNGGTTNFDSDGDVNYTIPNPHYKGE